MRKEVGREKEGAGRGESTEEERGARKGQRRSETRKGGRKSSASERKKTRRAGRQKPQREGGSEQLPRAQGKPAGRNKAVGGLSWGLECSMCLLRGRAEAAGQVC